MTVIHTNRCSSQRLARLAEINDTPGDMAASPYANAAPYIDIEAMRHVEFVYNRDDFRNAYKPPAPPDMAEIPYSSAEPKDARVLLPAILAGLVAVAVIAGVKFQVWTYFEGVL